MFKLFRNKTFVLIVIVALFGGLAYFTADYDSRGAAGGKCQVRVYGKCYRKQDVERLSQYFMVARELLLRDFAMSLFGEDRMDMDPTDFVTNLLVLREEAKRLGIEPTVEEAKKAIQGSPIFAMQTWINDDILEERVLSPRGLTKADLVQLGKDYLAWRKINDLLAAGNGTVPVEIEKAYIRDNQQFTAALAKFSREDFVEEVEVTDEEIETFYGERQGELLSDEKRGMVMVTFTPPAETEEMTAEQKAEQTLAFNNRVNEIYANAADDESKFGERIAKAAEDPANNFAIETEKIEPFAAVSPPEKLKDQNAMLGDVFSPGRGVEGGRSVTVPYPQEDGGYVILQITDIVEPTPLSLDEAREQIKKALVARESNLLVNEAATSARAKMLEALEAGKSQAEAAEAAGVELTVLPPFSRAEPPAKIDSAGQIVEAALRTPAGSVSEVLPMPLGDGYQFLFVEKSELVESDEEAVKKSSLRFAANAEYRRKLYQTWFRERIQDAGVRREGSVVGDESRGGSAEG